MAKGIKKRFLKVVKTLGGFVVVLIIWQFVHSLSLLEPTLFPSPKNTFETLFNIIGTGNILLDLSVTIIRMLVGLGLAVFFGVLFGLSIGLIKPLYESAEGVIDFFRSIPVTTLYPIFVLLFGIGHSSKIAMVFWASFFVITLNTAYGVIQSTKIRRKVAKLYGASNIQIFKWITFFDALPQTLIGIRVAISFSLIVEILCEMFMGSEYGIGQRITESFTTYAIPELYALILLSGILGFSFNRLFVVFEKKLVPWIGKL
jgi:NitT/TauT family transport system permease protein